MNISTLARRNVIGHLQRYLAYFLSCSFAVTIYFAYATFTLHPEVANGSIPAADIVRIGMIAAQLIIVVFSIFFIAYSNSAFLQVREKEFGLLSLFGMTNNQLRKLIYLEQTILSLAAIVAGIGFGLLFSKLFLMLMNFLLAVETPMQFQIIPRAFIETGLLFLILFQALTFYGLFRLKNRRIIDLIRAKKKPKPMPIASKWLTVLSITTLALGYTLAATANLFSAFFLVIPIVILVMIGTYFLFTQGMLALFKRLYANKNNLFRGTTLLTRTNILFRLKDHARMLFLTSIISAVLLTAGGIVFMFFQTFIDQGTKIVPQAIAWVEEDANQFQVIDPSAVEETFALSNQKIEYTVNTLALPGQMSLPVPYSNLVQDTDIMIVSQSEFNRVAQQKGLDTISLNTDEILLNTPFSTMATVHDDDRTETLHVKEQELSVHIVSEIFGEALFSSAGPASSIIVVRDSVYETLAASFNESDKMRLMGYELENWKDAVDVSNEIKAQVNPAFAYSLQTRAPEYQMLIQASALTIFIGVFISLLFFIVQGSMIYLKLFTEIGDTKQQLRSLHRIGITKEESARIINRQVQFLFFVPFVVGSIHAAFAYAMLGSILSIQLWGSGVLVISIYFVFQVFYYLLTKYVYQRAVLA
ncbi:FtsX-like permease family protein [Alkalicoccobacillus gibsonii]|uniref:FtsX-like permease family protein n=1 Tax=Alkalicoccobacillus gibsonii TaxID=79881 RepID=UPI003F7BFB45